VRAKPCRSFGEKIQNYRFSFIKCRQTFRYPRVRCLANIKAHSVDSAYSGRLGAVYARCLGELLDSFTASSAGLEQGWHYTGYSRCPFLSEYLDILRKHGYRICVILQAIIFLVKWIGDYVEQDHACAQNVRL